MSIGGRVYRALCKEIPSVGQGVRLDDAERHHLLRVRRLSAGATVEVLDGVGGVGRAIFDGTELICDSVHRAVPLPAVELAVAIPRGDRFDFVVEKCTELGVSAIWPLSTERGVARPSEKRVARWRRIAASAVKQSGQPYLPQISSPASIEDCLQDSSAKSVLLADREGDAVSLASGAVDPPLPILFFIGPEGGFSSAERAQILAIPATPVHLGRSVLRVETAAVLATGLLFGRLGALERGDRGRGGA